MADDAVHTTRTRYGHDVDVLPAPGLVEVLQPPVHDVRLAQAADARVQGRPLRADHLGPGTAKGFGARTAK